MYTTGQPQSQHARPSHEHHPFSPPPRVFSSDSPSVTPTHSSTRHSTTPAAPTPYLDYSVPSPASMNALPISFTDDMATKLSDSVCNRCRLYERDYSQHRPVAQSRAGEDESSERDCGVSQNESGKQRLSRGDAEVSFTDDMKTKLSDCVRRRCFNCRTIETSIWRGSKLSKGKVVCNRCGIYERTYARRRPVAQPETQWSADTTSDPTDPPCPHPHSQASFPVPAVHLHAEQNGLDDGEEGESLPGPSGSMSFTDDAATKLTDSLRRRCFNCRTAETTVWRRSNLSAGKILCNKCGLYERTHSRCRPEGFAQPSTKRGAGMTKDPTGPPSAHSPSQPPFSLPVSSTHAHQTGNGNARYSTHGHRLAADQLQQPLTQNGSDDRAPGTVAVASDGVMNEDSTACEAEDKAEREGAVAVVQDGNGKKRLREEVIDEEGMGKRETVKSVRLDDGEGKEEHRECSTSQRRPRMRVLWDML